MARSILGALVLLAATMSAAFADRRVTLLEFSDLDGWESDDHAAALAVFAQTCGDLRGEDWATLCAIARSEPPARPFFETLFKPVLIEDGEDMLFTGYYEPELSGADRPDARYRYPLYRLPEVPETGAWPTRKEIDQGAFAGQGLEIAWLSDPVDLIFLQIQGSGRIRLPGGRTIRVGYAGANGHPYASLGAELVARGVYEPHEVSTERIRDWVRANPIDGQDLLWTNQSYVFFREVNEVPADRGPLGAMNRSVTPLRSLAVDPAHYTLGAPVWIESRGAEPLSRLMVAQDTGAAIKGAQRADIFFGTGARAGITAGQIRDPGRMVTLLPIQRAYGMLPERLAQAR